MLFLKHLKMQDLKTFQTFQTFQTFITLSTKNFCLIINKTIVDGRLCPRGGLPLTQHDNGPLQPPPPAPRIGFSVWEAWVHLNCESLDGRLCRTRQSSSRTRRDQHDAAGALACARRHNDVTRCNDTGTLCANMTSSVKPEVLNISQRHHQSRTEPRPWVTCRKYGIV